MNYKFLVRRQMDKGMTLIELIVVVSIVGVLAAIALPIYLNQTSKARGSEAKNTLGSINRSQQVYHWENGTFASDLSELAVKVQQKFYTFSLGAGSATSGSAIADASTSGSADLKRYSAAVARTASGNLFTEVICESDDTTTVPATPTAPTTAGARGSCPAGSQMID